MERQVFRKKSLERLSSPEELNDYLHVTQPSVWVALIAVILLLAGLFIWSGFTAINSYITGKGTVRDGVMTIRFEDNDHADQVSPGMRVTVGGVEAEIDTIGSDADGRLIASAVLAIPDGDYDAKICYRHRKIIGLLLN
ncbi:MAG: hypothetical protein II553_03410 [Lachnospiraceae bacterium]|nr:hypothetical protein [Lachnospiraceae bacterium]MBQ3790256.1 hypothetical protein [Lachnospiraceae bacterium]